MLLHIIRHEVHLKCITHHLLESHWNSYFRREAHWEEREWFCADAPVLFSGILGQCQYTHSSFAWKTQIVWNLWYILSQLYYLVCSRILSNLEKSWLPMIPLVILDFHTWGHTSHIAVNSSYWWKTKFPVFTKIYTPYKERVTWLP